MLIICHTLRCNDPPRNDQITDLQKGGAANYKRQEGAGQ